MEGLHLSFGGGRKAPAAGRAMLMNSDDGGLARAESPPSPETAREAVVIHQLL